MGFIKRLIMRVNGRKAMKITDIINKNTYESVCYYYLNKEIDLDKCIIEIGKPLKIVYLDGSHFTHEDVCSVRDVDDEIITIHTTKKVWTLSRL